MNFEDNLNAIVNFSTIVEWAGRVNYERFKLISISSYDDVSRHSNLLSRVEAIRSKLPESMRNTDFRDVEYLTFRSANHVADNGVPTIGTRESVYIVPALLLTSEGLVPVSNTQPNLLVTPKSRSEYNLIIGTLRDLKVSFEVRAPIATNNADD